MANYFLFLILGLANCVRSGTYASNLSGYTKSGVLDQLSGLCCVLRVKGVSGNSRVEPISPETPNILRENKNYKSEIINPLVGEENETFCAYVSNSQENYVRAQNSGELLSFFKGNNNASFVVFSRKQMLKNKKLDYLLRTNKSGFILCDELSPSPSPSPSRDGKRELPNELLEKEVFKTSDEKIMARPNGKYLYCSPSPLQESSEGISEGLSTLKFLPTKDLTKHLCERRPKASEILTLLAADVTENVSSVKRNVSLVVLSSSQLVEGLDKWRKGLIHQKLPKKLLGQILRKTHDNRRIPFLPKRHSITASSKFSKATPSLGSSADTKQLSPETAQINSHEQQQPRLATEEGRNKRKLTTLKKLSSWSVLPNNAVRREHSSRRRSRSTHRLVKRRNVFETSPQTTNRFHNDEGKDESLLKWRRKFSTRGSIRGRGAASANTLRKETNDEDNKIKEADKQLIEELKNTTKKNESLSVGGRSKRSPPQEFLLRRSLHPEFVLEKVSLAYFETQPQEPQDIFELPSKEAADLEKESTNVNRKTSRGTNSLESSEKNHLRHHRNKKRKAAAAVLAAEGHSALLPCDVTSRVEHDAPILLMWFREGTHTPLFSVDFRQGTKGRPQIGHDLASPMTQRATLHVTTESQFYSREFLRSSNYSIDDLELFTASGGNLEINPVMLADEGVYKCRVDFLHSPTRNDRVNLTILIPTRSLELEWRRNGDWVAPSGEFLGPLIVGDSLHVVCKASPAWPPPVVIWTSDGARIDETFDQLVPVGGSSLDKPLTGGVNHLQLDQLQRSDHLRQLNCEAMNSNLTRPIVRSITLSVALPVISVTLDQPPTLDAGETAEVQCTVRGSYPPPIIKWSIGEEELEASQFWVSKDGNVTVSVVQVTPTAHQNGHPLICLAYNPILYAHKIVGLHQMKKDSKQINVEFSPEVAARLGRSLNGSRIKEGDDVYFECLVRANPAPHILEWTHNGQKLISRRGVFLTNGTLVIQRVNVSESGNYSCFAANTEGQARSGIVQLKVKFVPKCLSNSSKSYSIAKFEKARIPCNLTSNPTDVDFRWSFNNTAEMVDVPKGRYSSIGSVSVLNYTPMNELDYGTLLCWGANEVGKQAEPCVFHIKAAGKPEPPHNCRVKQTTLSSLWVTCLPGSDGGDPQIFHLQVQLVSTITKIVNEVTNSSPDFFVANLQPNMRYRLLITAANRRGESHPARELLTRTAKLGTPRQETNAEATRGRKTKEDDKKKVIMGITLAGTSAALVSLLLGVWACVRVRSKRRQNAGVNVSVDTEMTITNPDATAATQEKITREHDKNRGAPEPQPSPLPEAKSEAASFATHLEYSEVPKTEDPRIKERTRIDNYKSRLFGDSKHNPYGDHTPDSKSLDSDNDSSAMFPMAFDDLEPRYEICETQTKFDTMNKFRKKDSTKESHIYEYSHRIFVEPDEYSTELSNHPSSSSLVPLAKSFPVPICDRRTSVSGVGTSSELSFAAGNSSVGGLPNDGVTKVPYTEGDVKDDSKAGYKSSSLEASKTISPFYNISGFSQTKLAKLPR